MKIVSSAEMREIDRLTSERFGVPLLSLMENAGEAVAAFVVSRYPQAKTVGVVCGKGNNGGDGLVAARKLRASGREVKVLLLADPSELRGDAAENFTRLPVAPVIARTEQDLGSSDANAVLASDVVIDAILGSGFRPPVSGLYAAAIIRLNATPSPVIAVDVPSGADADVMGRQQSTMAHADAIVTFTASRPAHVFGGLTEGPTIIAPIGSPNEAIISSLGLNLITAHDVAPLIAPRSPSSHKGSYGHALVIGGSVGKAGAAAMAGFAVLRVGAGLSTVAIPRSILPTVAGFHPESMTEPLEETEAGTISLRALSYGNLDALAKGKTVLAIGPGISRNTETSEFVRTVVKKLNQPIVVDADALNAFEGHASDLNGRGRVLILTPHPGEMARLVGSSTTAIESDRLHVARAFAREHEVILVLKGHRTLVAFSDGTVWVNPTGNAGMATGGTGDILTGMIAGLTAQHVDRVPEAVFAAVYLHGAAGDAARDTFGEYSMTAADLLPGLPQAFSRTREEANRRAVEIHG